MISCDLFFFRFKNTWQFSVPVLRKLHYEVMKDYISNAAYFLTVCPKKGCLNAPRAEAFQIQLQSSGVGWVLAPTSSPAQITVFCDWHRSTGHTHPSPGSEKNKTSILGSVCLMLYV